MRSIGLIVAASLIAACGAPGGDNSSENAETAGNVAAATVAEADNEQPDLQANGATVASAENDVPAPASPCLTQDSDRLQVDPIRAVGTEPFWGARVEGRCVTYSTPENQQGVRVWTRYSDQGGGRSTWAGQLGGKKFEMRIRPEAGCSDGMSDERYPIAVELTVGGEMRTGCAEPLKP